MKKCTLILMVLLAIAACKKMDKTAGPDTSKADQETVDTKCITLKEYDTITNLHRKVQWLKKKGDKVCDSILEEAVLKIHEVKGAVSNKKGTYVISWKGLKDTIKDHKYDYYLSVEVDTVNEKIISLRMVPNYLDEKYCFSTALIRSLSKNHGKQDNNAKFQFSLAKIDNKSKRAAETVVVIQVNGTPFYYDYSTEPPFLSNDNKPL